MQPACTSLINSLWTTDARGLRTKLIEAAAGLLPLPDGAPCVEWMRSLHPDDGARLALVAAAAMQAQQGFRHEHRVLCSDHGTRWVVTTGIPRFGDEGQSEGYAGAVVDITEQQHGLERALRSEAEHRLMVDNSMDLIAHCGTDGRYIYVSPSYSQVLGWKAEEMVGQRVIDFLHPEEQAASSEGLRRIFMGEDRPNGVEVRKRHRDGQYIALGTKTRKVTDPGSGLIVGAVLVSRDITREKEMLKRIERMAEQNTALIENSPDIMMMLDLQGTVLHVNKAIEQIQGFRREELIGQPGSTFIRPEGRAQASEMLRLLNQGESHVSSNMPCLCSDGRTVLLESNLYRPHGSQQIYVAARDVTEKHGTRLALENAHARVQTILESINDGFFSVNKNWEITYANTLAAAFVGVDRDNAIGKVVWEVAAGLAESSVAPFYRRAMERRENTSFEALYEPAGVFVSARVYAHDEGLSIFFHDISERVKSDLIIRESEKRFRQTIEITPAGYVLADAAGIVQEVNPALCQLSGYARQELIGSHIAGILLSGGDDTALDAGRAGEQAHALETVIRHRQGHLVYALVNQTIERNADGQALSLTAFVTDITARKHAEARLEHLATRDVLTGLPNRAWLNQHLKTMLGQAHTHAATVLFIDLNRFKEVNDSMGHAAGDYLLQQVSARLQSCMRPGDVVARLGGDEFVVAANCAGPDAAAGIAQRLLAALKLPFYVDGLEMCIGASIGISLSADGVDTAEQLFQNADTAMYRAKAAGDSSYRFFEPEMSVEAKRRLQIEMAMRHALELDQFRVHYQPRIDLRSMRIRSMEALLRWNHPELGQIAPLEFIPIAEERGHIEAIGKWVLNEACREAKRLIDDYGIALHVSVNVSARQLRSADLVGEVEQALRESGLAADALELELTESALIEDIDQSAALLLRLKNLGVRVSLDDFGTGYSSLSYLKRFPVDVLKLDRSFLHAAPSCGGNGDFVKALIDMAHALGLTVVAEGIETGEVAETLRQADCDQGQGYLFAKPMAVADLEKWLQCELPGRIPLASAALAGR
jgi:diguanylate cyclase (GGDEF)-like protein/PAS domain S-box-containing protein